VTRADPVEERAALAELLGMNRLLALSTVSPTGDAHVNTAFFAPDQSFTLFMLSPPGTEHARHLRTNPSAAVSVFDSHQTHHQRRGAQLFGRMSQLDGADAESAFGVFGARFDDIRAIGPSAADVFARTGLRFFALVPQRAKVFDELRLQKGDYVEFQL
jgi:uncharacterized protein YhbP (UPF0306 family)